MPKTASRSAGSAPTYARPRLLAPDDSPPAVTLTAAEIAKRTGVGRERLRTWERRHGFPQPVRQANNVRRYAVDDVRRILAVRRSVERGVPLAEAIDDACRDRPSRADELVLGAALDHAPMPAMAVRGTVPITVAWHNGASGSATAAPALGTDLMAAAPAFGAVALAAIEQMLVGFGPSARLVEHGDWTSAFPQPSRSLAWRLPPELSTEPVVVLQQLAIEREPATLRDPLAVWIDATADARRTLQRERGIAAAQRALSVLVDGTGAVDAFLATCRPGVLRSATSVRGALAPRAVELPGAPELERVLRSGRHRWLASHERRTLGLPAGTFGLLIPMVGAGEIVGAAVIAFPEEVSLPPAAAELLAGFATGVAATLQREQRRAASGGDQTGR